MLRFFRSNCCEKCEIVTIWFVIVTIVELLETVEIVTIWFVIVTIWS
jgi:hypothetical protein